MAVRHNTCENPALKNDVTGWGGNATPTRTDVTGEGFGRQFAARYTSGTFTRSAPGAATAGLQYTLSVHVYMDNAFAHNTGNIYIEWRKANDDVISYDSTGYDVPGRVVTRISITATAPALAARAHIITDGVNFGASPSDFTQVLIEQTASLAAYFDGDTSPGGSWDGADGSSASTLNDLQQETGETATAAGAAISTATMKGGQGAAVAAEITLLTASGTKQGAGQAATTAGPSIRPTGSKSTSSTPRIPSGSRMAAAGSKTSTTAAAAPSGATLRAAGVKHASGSCVLAGGAAVRPAQPGDVDTGDITVRPSRTQRRIWSGRTGRAWSGRTGTT